MRSGDRSMSLTKLAIVSLVATSILACSEERHFVGVTVIGSPDLSIARLDVRVWFVGTADADRLWYTPSAGEIRLPTTLGVTVPVSRQGVMTVAVFAESAGANCLAEGRATLAVPESNAVTVALTGGCFSLRDSGSRPPEPLSASPTDGEGRDAPPPAR